MSGSIAEKILGSEKMKNTSAVFNPKGELVGKYTKVISMLVETGGEVYQGNLNACWNWLGSLPR